MDVDKRMTFELAVALVPAEGAVVALGGATFYPRPGLLEDESGDADPLPGRDLSPSP